MMTRQEATQALCPFMVKRTTATMNAYGQITTTKYEQAPCRANACPMWEDERREDVCICAGESRFVREHHRAMPSSGMAECRAEHGLGADCAGCPDIYGHCGGRG